jgi:hypothetical protein
VASNSKISTHIILSTGSRSRTLSGPKNCNVSGRASPSCDVNQHDGISIDLTSELDPRE